ncbi:MAG TPA: TetR/AcrR family transcriptional regulator [Clostridiales bacterium]|nr:TetR/AcrR family transcriptional regulator [Clostridiales bacterium]
MGDKVYSEKQIAIFNAIIELMKNGINPYSIKVSDIAEAAGIGKGTIYDYFNSKEEAISEAILYSVAKEIEYGYSRIKSQDSFKEKFYELLYMIAEKSADNVSTFNMLLSIGEISKLYEFLLDEKYDLSEYVYMANQIIKHILKAGIEEGIISTTESIPYQIIVTNSLIMGFSQYIRQKDLYPHVSLEETIEMCYKAVVKVLN